MPHKFQQGQAAYIEIQACLLTKGPAGTGSRRDYSTRLQQQQGVSLPSCADARQAKGAAYRVQRMALSCLVKVRY